MDLQLMRGRGRGGCKENDFNFRYANLMDSLSKIRMQTKGTQRDRQKREGEKYFINRVTKKKRKVVLRHS